MNELIRKAKNGDREALTELILKKKSELVKTAKRLLKNEQDVEDLVQETLISAYFKIHKLKHEELFDIWLKKIMINQCNRIYRRKYKKEIPMSDDLIDKITKSNIDKNIIEKEDLLDFRIFIRKLRHDEKMILILYYEEKYTTKEISEILEIKEGTVKSKISRAKIKLKEIKEKRGGKIYG